MEKKKNFKVIVTHPIQYHAVLWRNLAKIENVDFEVLFCSDHGQSKSLDKDFGVAFKWDVPLKDGYKSRTFTNIGCGNGFFKYINLGLLFNLLFSRSDYVYFHGVNNLTAYAAFWISKLKGNKTVIRNIAHSLGEPKRSKFKNKLRDIIYGNVYRNASFCLFIGQHNKNFFQNFRVGSNCLVHAPHIVDNDFFINRKLRKMEREEFRNSLKIEDNRVVLLFCGKLTSVKQPLMLLEAFDRSQFTGKVTLLFVGDGVLRSRLELEASNIIKKDVSKDIKFMGFKNQTELPSFYSISDILLLPSFRETWGLVVNEALCFSNAAIVGDYVGCGPELVEGKTGFVFNKDNVAELKDSMEKLVNNEEIRRKYQQNAKSVISAWGVNEYIEAVKKIING